MTEDNLTIIERDVLITVINYVNSNNIAPSQRRISELTGHNLRLVNNALKSLKRKRKLKRCENKYIPR